MHSILPQHLLWQEHAKSKGLAALGAKIAAELAQCPYFCLWLVGDIGAGKTTLTGFILHSLGLDPKIPVTSPTYSYINDYEIKGKNYGHIDLYRASPEFSPTELFHLDEGAYAGLLVEWPEIVAKEHTLPATHLLSIAYGGKGSGREYHFYRV